MQTGNELLVPRPVLEGERHSRLLYFLPVRSTSFQSLGGCKDCIATTPGRVAAPHWSVTQVLLCTCLSTTIFSFPPLELSVASHRDDASTSGLRSTPDLSVSIQMEKSILHQERGPHVASQRYCSATVHYCFRGVALCVTTDSFSTTHAQGPAKRTLGRSRHKAMVQQAPGEDLDYSALRGGIERGV